MPPAMPHVAGTDPCPAIWEGVGTAEYWNKIGAEGIFPVPAPLRETATVTLGELYLKQGHFDEAQQTFGEVLEREPDNRAALVGLDAARSAQSSMTASGKDTETKERKARALKRYLERLRSGSDRMDH